MLSNRTALTLPLANWLFGTRMLSSAAAANSKMKTIETLKFDNRALRELPVDKAGNAGVRQVPHAIFALCAPTPLKNPKLIAYSPAAMTGLLELGEDQFKRKDFPLYFCGNHLPPGSQTAAHCYCGHQFGYFSGQLGDGAAMYMGEVVNSRGERWEIQMKGSGKTPFSRSADGRKVLRSTVREFLCSEAMHFLGVPTTRGGTCVTSDSYVSRDIFYSGDPKQERCTVVLRIAPSFIRFGSFEICKEADPATGRSGPSPREYGLLHALATYCLKNFYPEIETVPNLSFEQKMFALYDEICRRTARMVAKWQAVGFCHGVLNTDNMSIVGVTIDYGPYGFLDRYHAEHVCNSSDDGARYTYAKQPKICHWNLGRLSEQFGRLILWTNMGGQQSEKLLTLPRDAVEEVISRLNARRDECYWKEFETEYNSLMVRKLGLIDYIDADTYKSCGGDGRLYGQSSAVGTALTGPRPGGADITDDDKELVEDFFGCMEATGADFTNSFRSLSMLKAVDGDQQQLLERLLDQCCSAEQLKLATAPKMDRRQLELMLMLRQANPELLAALGGRGEALEHELEAMEKHKELENLTDAEKREQDRKVWSEWVDRYCKRVVQASKVFGDKTTLPHIEVEKFRTELQDSTNPRYILRNHIAQRAIELAEKGDYAEVNRVLHIFESPFTRMQASLAAAAPAKDSMTAPSKQTEEPDAVHQVADDDYKASKDGAEETVPKKSYGQAAACSRTAKACSSGGDQDFLYDERPPEWAESIRVS